MAQVEYAVKSRRLWDVRACWTSANLEAMESIAWSAGGTRSAERAAEKRQSATRSCPEVIIPVEASITQCAQWLIPVQRPRRRCMNMLRILTKRLPLSVVNWVLTDKEEVFRECNATL